MVNIGSTATGAKVMGVKADAAKLHAHESGVHGDWREGRAEQAD